MDDQIRLTSIGSQLTVLSASNNDLLAQMGVLQNEIHHLRSSIKNLRGNLSIVQWLVCLMAAFLISMAVLACYFGKAFTNNLIRDVIEEENRGRYSLIQYGFFSSNTKISDNPLTFDLKLAQPINLNNVVAVTTEPSAFIPGVSVETRLRDGKVCRVIFNGNTNSFQKLLNEGVQGKVIFTMKN